MYSTAKHQNLIITLESALNHYDEDSLINKTQNPY